MKRTILVASLMLLLATAPVMAQMMRGGHMMGDQGGQEGEQMMEQPQMEQTAPTGGQYYNQYMYPGMMGGYGMGPGMMGGYGYGMGPGMMGGYGYGMGPGMMGYGMGPGMMGGYGMGPGMMGGYGYGMGPGMMMGGYGKGSHMMGGHGCGMGSGMMGYYSPEQYEKQYKENQQFLDETRDLRKKLHTLKFDYAEARRNPDTKGEDLEKMNAEMEDIWKQIYEKKNK